MTSKKNNTCISLFILHCRIVRYPSITGHHGVHVTVFDTFISMCSAPSSFQTKDLPSRKLVGGQIDKVISAQNNADTHPHTKRVHTHKTPCIPAGTYTHIQFMHSKFHTHTDTHAGSSVKGAVKGEQIWKKGLWVNGLGEIAS